MWDSIALELYGDERHFTLLMDANPDYADVLVFGANIQLRVPPPPDTGYTNLPDWKR